MPLSAGNKMEEKKEGEKPANQAGFLLKRVYYTHLSLYTKDQ